MADGLSMAVRSALLSGAGAPAGPTLGPDVVTNGDFSSAVGWTLASGVTISGGKLNTGIAAFATAYRNWNVASINGATYQCTVVVDIVGNCNPKVDIGPSWSRSAWKPAFTLAAGVNTFTFTANSAESAPLPGVQITNYANGSIQAVIDSISIQKIG